jgi:hypothetical protein
MAQSRYPYSLFFVDPTFLVGMASVFDLAGVLPGFNSAATPALADFLALQYDWYKVGQDLYSAMNAFKQTDLSKAQQMELAGIATG